MRKGWKIILIIVAVCLAVGIVSAGVGTLTGADTDRIGAILEQRVGERNNVDLDALIHEWVPEVAGIMRDRVSSVIGQFGSAK